jgi:hypothetical protein
MKIALLLASSMMTASLVSARRPATTEKEVFDFPDTVDTLDAVPERARGLYEEKEGKFVYTDTGGLRNALRASRTERDAMKREADAAKAWKALGKSPEEIQTLLDEQRTVEEQKLADKGQWDSLKSQMETNHQAVVSAKDAREKKILAALEKATIHDRARAALSDPDIEGNPLFLLPAISGRVKLEETDDGFTPVVLREDGSPMLNAKNEPASMKDLFLEFRGQEQWAGAFKGLNQSGGGASGGGGKPPTSGKNRSKMTAIEKVAYIKEHGQPAYAALPE